MDAQAVWLVVLSVATPLAGVVGFALQLRQVKQTRLENEKLHLEINALKSERAERESLVRVATMDEVMRFSGSDETMFSRGSGTAGASPPNGTRKLRETLLTAGLAILAMVFLGYLAYDIFRLGRWLLGGT